MNELKVPDGMVESKIATFYTHGEVRCLKDGKPSTWEAAMKEVHETVSRLSNEGFEVEVLFKNQCNEITPCNQWGELFYFLYIARRPR